jgi:V/A-type H+/Na+-transporting ATPase subunit K
MEGIILGVLGAAIAVIVPAVGSAISVSRVGESAAGLISEEPEKFGKALLLQVLPGTQGIYGFLAAVLALQKLGIFGDEIVAVSSSAGWQILFACFPIAIAGFISAIFQGKVSVSGVSVLAKKPDEVGKAIILSAMVETYAVIALLASILILNGITV